MAAPKQDLLSDFGSPNLEFQDLLGLGIETSPPPAPAMSTLPSGSSFDDQDSIVETDALLNRANSEGPGGKKISFWELAYYRNYFDVTAADVLSRIIFSVVPRLNHVEASFRPNADLYGPLWISVTLVVASTISHGVTHFLTNLGSECAYVYTDFNKMSFTITAVFVYTFLLPAIVWSYLKYSKCENRHTLVEFIALNGYALSIFVFVAALWPILSSLSIALRDIVLAAAGCASGIALLAAVWPGLRDLPFRSAIVVAAVIVISHILLTIGFGVYMFVDSLGAATVVPASTTTAPPSTTSSTTTVAPSSTPTAPPKH